MINYKIIKLDKMNGFVQIRYSKDNYPDFYVKTALPFELSEESVHKVADEQVEQAVRFWNKLDALSEFELSNSDGSIKDVVYEDKPSIDTANYKAVAQVIETEDTITHTFTVEELSDGEKASMARRKRDLLLSETDSEMVTDRTPSEEMTNYRQQLRDLTSQEGFPNTVVWPIKPI